MNENLPAHHLWLELQTQDCVDEQTFLRWSNALLEMKVKRVSLAKKFEVLMQYKLAQYGMQNVSGAGNQPATGSDWVVVVRRVKELIDNVRMATIDAMEEHLDDEFLLRLRMIHVGLLELREVQALQMVPVEEMVFCLAVFLLSFEDETNYGMFRLLLLPVDVVKFLRAIISCLEELKSNGSDGKASVVLKYGKQFHKLRYCHSQVEELYGLVGIRMDVMAVCSCDYSSICVKGILPQIISRLERGLKTPNSLLPALTGMLVEIVERHQKIVGSYQSCENQEHLYNEISKQVPLLRILSEFALFLKIRSSFKSLLISLRKCQSFRQIKLLCRYVGTMKNVSEYYEMLYHNVVDFYTRLEQYVSKENRGAIIRKMIIIRELGNTYVSGIVNKLSQYAVLTQSTVDLRSIHYSIQLDLTSNVDKTTVSSICDLWGDVDLEMEFFESMKLVSPKVYQLEVSDMLNDFAQDLSNSLGLLPWFNQCRTEANSERKFIYYDDSIAEIKSLLAQCGCSSVEEIVKTYQKLSASTIIELCCWLQRCFNYFRSVNLLSDDSAFLKGGHGLVFGRMFFNFLNADDPNYRAMVSDGNLMVVLAALLFTEVPHEAFFNRKLLVGQLADVRIDGLSWVKIQKRLIQAILNNDETQVQSLVDLGAYTESEFYYFLGDFEAFGKHSLVHIVACELYCLIENREEISFVANLMNNLDKSDYKIKAALRAGHYDKAFDYSKKQIESLEMDFFSWESLIPALNNAGKDVSLWNQFTLLEVMRKLVERGNLQSTKSLLEFHPQYIPSDEDLVRASLSGCADLFQLLIGTRQEVGDAIILPNIAAHMHRALEPFILRMQPESIERALLVAVKVNNLELFKSISTHPKIRIPFENILPTAILMGRRKIVEVILDSCRGVDLDLLQFTAATGRRWKMVEFLTNRGADLHARSASSDRSSTTFQIAISAGSMKVVKRIKPINNVADKFRDDDLLTLAASTGSSKLMKVLLKMGFSVLHEKKLFHVVWRLRNQKLEKLLLDCLNPTHFIGSTDTITNWCYSLQKWKLLPYLRYLKRDHHFKQSDESYKQLMQFVLRRMKLYETIDAKWCVKDIQIFLDNKHQLKMQSLDDEVYYEYSQYITDLELICKNLTEGNCFTQEIHIFNTVQNSFAFLELVQYNKKEGNIHKTITTEQSITLSMIEQKMFNCLDENESFSCSIRIFHNEADIERFELIQLGPKKCLVELQPIDRGATWTEITTKKRLQLAIESCDMASVQWLLNQVGKVEHEDVWLDPSLAHTVIASSGMTICQKAALLKQFFTCGMKFSIRHPDWNASATAYALSKEFGKLADKMIDWSCEGLTISQQLLMVIQQGSIDVFKLYVSKHKISPDRLFTLISNALQELYVKQVPICSSLQTYLWFILSEYGFSNMCTDLPSPEPVSKTEKVYKNPKTKKDLKNSEERQRWIPLIYFIIEDVRKLQYRYDRGRIFGIDNEVLFHFRMIHKHLFLVKDKKDLMNLPLTELTFLLAVFLSTFNEKQEWKEDNTMYRAVLNKLMLMSLLEYVADQLEEFLIKNSQSNSDESAVFIPTSSKQQKRKRTRLLKLYHRVKQMYSLRKIYLTLKQFDSDGDSKEIAVASIKRFNQIFGECIKSTKKSPNLPSKLNQILNNQLCYFIRLIQKTRDVTCHDYPLGRKHFSLDDQFLYYSSTAEYLKMVKVTVAMLVICTCNEYLRCLYGTLLQCGFLYEKRSFMEFCGNQSAIKNLQDECFGIIFEYQNEVLQSLDAVPCESLEPEQQRIIHRLRTNYDKRSKVVDKLREFINHSFSYDFNEIQIMAFSASSSEQLNKLIMMNLIPKSDEKILEYIENNWKVLAEDTYALSSVLKSPEIGVGFLITTIDRMEINQNIFHENYCHEEILRIIQFFGFADDNDELRTNLEGSLKKYFNNIFLIDSKTQGIKQGFRKFRINNFNDKCKTIRNQDLQVLQNIVCDKQRSIRTALSSYNCSSIEQLCENANCLPRNALLAIEYWLLELCEILITAKQFQDNFYSIKQDLQMICGRNFRNYLAHDSLSYNLLTCSPSTKLLVNALVMAEKDWKLYRETAPGILGEAVDSRTEAGRWLAEQKALFIATLQTDVDELRRLTNQGSLTTGKFRFSISGCRLDIVEAAFLMRPDILEVLGSRKRNALALVDPLWHDKLESIAHRELKLSMALRSSRFRSATDFKAEQTWGQLVKSQLLPQSDYPCLGNLLSFLDEERKYEDILNIFSSIDPKYISAAMSTRSPDAIRHILKVMPSKLADAQMHTILTGAPEDFVSELIPEKSIKCIHLETAIMSVNWILFHFFLDKLKLKKDEAISSRLLEHCARLGRLRMMKCLLVHLEIPVNELNLAMNVSCKHQHWRIAFLLMENNANPWARIFPGEFNAGEMAIVECNVKATNTFFKTLSTPIRSHFLLSGVAEYGTVRMFKLLLRKGCDLWYNNRVLLNVKDNKRDSLMAEFIENAVFDFKLLGNYDDTLIEWMRFVHEFNLIENYKGHLPKFLTNAEWAKKIFRNFIELGKTNDGMSIRNIDTCISNTNYIESLEAFTSIDRNIEQQSPTGTPSQLQLQLEYQDLTLQIELGIYNAETELPHFLQTVNESRSIPTPSRICLDTIHLIDKQTKSSAIAGQFELNLNRFRFLRLGNCCYIAEIENTKIPSFVKSLFNFTSADGETVLHYLPTDVDVELLRILLSTGVDPTLLDSKGCHALLLMFNAGCSWQVLEFMLQYCYENNVRNSEGTHIFNVPDSDGYTLLSHAIAHGYSRVVHRLLAFGVDQNVPNKSGRFSIHYAVVARNVSIVKALIKNQPDIVNTQGLHDKETPLLIAVRMNNDEIVRLLLNANADISLRDCQGNNVVAIAILMSSNTALETILDHAALNGIDVMNNVSEDSSSALHLALLGDNVDAFEIVLGHLVGSQVNTNMKHDSLLEMKKILLFRGRDMMNIFDEALLTKRVKIQSYLTKCEALYMELTGELLRKKGDRFNFDMYQYISNNTNTKVTLVDNDDLD